MDHRGWSVPHWPLEHGGRDWSIEERYLLDRTLAQAGVPGLDPFLVDLMGPLIIEAGSALMQAEYLPHIRTGRASWCSLLETDSLPVSGRRGESLELAEQSLLIRGAADAERLVVLVDPDGRSPTLGLVDIQAMQIFRGLPMDPDRLDVRDAVVETIGAQGEGRRLLDRGMRRAERVPRSRVARVRGNLDRLEASVRELGDESLDARLSQFEIDLLGLDVLEQRTLTGSTTMAASHADAGQAAIRVRLRELKWEMSLAAADALGYYALPAFDSNLMSNEGRPGPDVGWDAIAELFGYVGSLEDMTDRDRIAAGAFGTGVGTSPDT